MTATQPLTGVILIDCAKANAAQGIDVATQLCGYGSDTESFQAALRQAGKDMGITLDDMSDLLTHQDV